MHKITDLQLQSMLTLSAQKDAIGKKIPNKKMIKNTRQLKIEIFVNILSHLSYDIRPL